MLFLKKLVIHWKFQFFIIYFFVDGNVEPMSGIQTTGQDSTNSQQTLKEANETASETNANFSYDLYAVCNHHGDDLQGGHYTATCRNPTDGQW